MTKTRILKTQLYRMDRSHYSDTLDHLHTQAQTIEQGIERMRALVIQARQEGATWEDVARELGVSRSAAWQRFGPKD